MDDANLKRDLELLDSIYGGSYVAKEELLRKYVPLVRHIARKHVYGPLEFDDLLQEGMLGLLAAIDEYDYNRYQVKFCSFAYLCVTRRVYNVIRQSKNNKHKALNSAVLFQPWADGGFPEGRRWSDRTDPCLVVEEKWIDRKLDEILRSRLSSLEYLVVVLLARGYCMKEIEARLNVSAKAIDNARTRAKAKIKRILERHGSLLDPSVPLHGRRRPDLCMCVGLAAK